MKQTRLEEDEESDKGGGGGTSKRVAGGNRKRNRPVKLMPHLKARSHPEGGEVQLLLMLALDASWRSLRSMVIFESSSLQSQVSMLRSTVSVGRSVK